MAYSLVYSPDINPFDGELKFICSDNRIHFRFRDFQHNEHIQGFEKKLIYLMEYLFNFCYKPSLNVNTPFEKEYLLNDFLQTQDVKTLTNILSKNIPSLKFKGLKAYFNYNKQEDFKPFGNVKDSYFPIRGNNSLKEFSNKLRVTISEFLFNDRYSILLRDGYKDNINKKFKNKFVNQKVNLGDDLLVKLW